MKNFVELIQTTPKSQKSKFWVNAFYHNTVEWERYHEYIKTMVKWYQGRWNKHMMQTTVGLRQDTKKFKEKVLFQIRIASCTIFQLCYIAKYVVCIRCSYYYLAILLYIG